MGLHNGVKSFLKWHLNCTGSLASADFGGAGFASEHFQKIAQIICNFHYISVGILSFVRFWLQ